MDKTHRHQNLNEENTQNRMTLVLSNIFLMSMILRLLFGNIFSNFNMEWRSLCLLWIQVIGGMQSHPCGDFCV